MKTFETDIDIYYHVFLADNFYTFSIFNEQIFLLHISGLLYEAKSINIVIVHSGNDLNVIQNVRNLIKNYNLNDNIFIRQIISSGNECLTGDIMIKDLSKSEKNNYILYFHTKGASHYGGETEMNTKYWRHFMEYYCILNWKNCISKFEEGFESVGVLWFDQHHMILENKEGDGFYAGTFYWIHSDLLRQIKNLGNIDFNKHCLEELPALKKHKHFSFNDIPLEEKMDFYYQIYHPKKYYN